VVEDERRVRSFLVRGLTEEGFGVRECDSGTAALAALAAEPFDLVLLDWMLPGKSGLEVLRQLREDGLTVPVVMLTARDAVEDRISALNAGADDYVTKPFSFEELLARVRALQRRMGGRGNPVLSYADLVLDPVRRRVMRAGTALQLTAREFALLQFLLENAEEVVSRARIAEAVWDHDYDTFSNVVEVYIRYLRAKVDEPFPQRLIHTVRGFGYVLRREP
jgi:DNA-binding response OmpR family regulator